MNLRHAAVMAVLFSTPAWAQAVERQQDRRELRQERREKRDDRRDAAWAASLLARYDSARAHRDRRALHALEAEALQAMDRELAEGRVELAKSRTEAARSGGEVARSRTDVAYARGGGERAQERAELRDDRRDRRDDVRDARGERRDLSHMRAIRADFASLRGRMDAQSTARKRALLADYLQRSRAEQLGNAAERAEDRRELREDRSQRR